MGNPTARPLFQGRKIELLLSDVYKQGLATLEILEAKVGSNDLRMVWYLREASHKVEQANHVQSEKIIDFTNASPPKLTGPIVE